ncbi:cellulose biosynthesis cyclic di-GMP-binding regulatory protein BcsB [Aureimonas psammosilenae]|uniref:cellulose biosynthesis cyclic di-GMP-binding regulatory protein BcsB n=1 Tax=Aureimonas psammosilenae TaxID=2495496 RepID=UPI001260D4E1|nr:cellulose biosynthesis cyclic di-GMP-binding regulatory protein BcsB [Aureimonas psammosilenae]
MSFSLRHALAGATILGTTFAASAVLAANAPAAFDPSAGQPSAALASATNAPSPGLRRFALENDQLSFSGENRRLDFPVFVTARESAAPARVVLNIDSAISVMPENSRMKVLVNDLQVSDVTLGRSGRQAITAELPAGLLQPGLNAVRILVEQHHRVDCSLPGTYELWTHIDPATSGIVYEGVSPAPGGLAELGAVRPGADGRVAVRGILAKSAMAPAIDGTMNAIQSATLMGYFDAPVVEFANTQGQGPGLDVVVGTVAEVASLVGEAKGNTDIPFVSLLSSEGGERQTLVVSGVSTDDVRRNLADLATYARLSKPAGPLAGQESLVMYRGRAIGSGETVRLGELGVDTRPFAGRSYKNEFRVVLPADFYAADYDYASIALDASFSAGLKEDAQLVIRANDKVVTTLQLSSSKSGQLRQQKMRVPLNALKPGINVFRMEAMVPNASDALCEVAAQASPPVRFTLSDSSSFTMPRFAQVGHAPDISSMTAGIAEANRAMEKGVTVFVPNYDRQLLGAAATFVAKIASSTRRLQPVTTTSVMPTDLDDDLIAFGGQSGLPPELFDTIRIARAGDAANEVASSASLISAANAGPVTSIGAALSEADTMKAAMQAAEDPSAAVNAGGAAISNSAHRALDDLSISFGWAASQITNFASAQTSPKLFTPSPDAALTVAQMPSPTHASSSWTMVTAPGTDRVVSGVLKATTRDRWASLGGAVTEISADKGLVSSHEATSERLYETQPRSLGNARLVLAGWFSRHTEQYLVAIIGTLLLLGFSTALFLRTVGERNS